MAKKINVVTLGCSKNLVDSELFLSQMKANGYQVSHDADGTDARIVAINTCGFILDAKEESIDTIMEYVDAKNQGLIDKIFVFGCLTERYKEDLLKEVPEVDGFYGKFQVKKMVEDLKTTVLISFNSNPLDYEWKYKYHDKVIEAIRYSVTKEILNGGI